MGVGKRGRERGREGGTEEGDAREGRRGSPRAVEREEAGRRERERERETGEGAGLKEAGVSECDQCTGTDAVGGIQVRLGLQVVRQRVLQDLCV